MDITFIEAKPFTQSIKTLKAEQELNLLKDELDKNPEKGDLIQGTGGLRKVRMRLPGKGKSGGARVLYLYMKVGDVIYFIYAYPKSEMENVSAKDKRMFKEVINVIKEKHK